MDGVGGKVEHSTSRQVESVLERVRLDRVALTGDCCGDALLVNV